MKKFFILCISIFCLAIFIDFFAYSVDYISTAKRAKAYNSSCLPFKYVIFLDKFSTKTYLDLSKNIYRKPLNTESNLKPIYIFGCSYAYGHYLDEEETFGKKLAQYTHRPVYNFSYPGWGIQHILFMLHNLHFPNTKQPEYIIYVYMSDHIRRMNAKWFAATDSAQNLIYKKKNDSFFVETSFSGFYLYRKISALYNTFYCKNIHNRKVLSNHFFKYIDAVQNEIRLKFPESKFVIVAYDDDNILDWSEIERKGIKVLKVNDFIQDIYSPEYMRKDMHPNGHAWDVITSQIIKSIQ